MVKTNIKSIIQSDIHNVWETVLAVKNYNKWRSDISKTEIINENKFIEYTKDGYSTTFTVTVIEPLNRWEFDIENMNIKGHWVGIFTAKDDKTEVDFTEQVTAKKFLMKPFVKSYLRKQQMQFVMDLKKVLEK